MMKTVEPQDCAFQEGRMLLGLAHPHPVSVTVLLGSQIQWMDWTVLLLLMVPALGPHGLTARWPITLSRQGTDIGTPGDQVQTRLLGLVWQSSPVWISMFLHSFTHCSWMSLTLPPVTGRERPRDGELLCLVISEWRGEVGGSGSPQGAEETEKASLRWNSSWRLNYEKDWQGKEEQAHSLCRDSHKRG